MGWLADSLRELFSAMGGGVAFSFLVVIVFGIAALTLFFAASAVLVLERFARAPRRPLTLIVVGLLWSVGTAWLFLQRAEAIGAELPMSAELATGVPWSELPAWSAAVAATLTVFFAMGVVAVLLRALRGRALLILAALWLGLAGALFVAGAALPELRLSAAGAGLFGLFGSLVLLGLLPLAAVGFLGMRGRAEWFIALRYLVAKRRQTFISLITLICVVGVAAGVWLIITVLSVMNGFERVWRDEIIRNRAHFTIHSGAGAIEEYREVLNQVREVPQVVAAAPYLDAEGMVRGAHGQIVGVRVRGIDPEHAGDVTDLRQDLVQGSLEDLRQEVGGKGENMHAIIIGSRLAAGLGVALGDPVVLISPFGGPPTPFGPGPRLSRFRVVGVFESSFFQYDEAFTYVALAAAQDFRRVGDMVDGIEVRVNDHLRSRRIARAVEEVLGIPYFTRDWKELFPAFFQALKTEQVMMFLLLTMIMVVAAFVIVATLIMMIMEKAGDIAILKAMGARDALIERIFAIEGTLIGLFGTALGVAAGIAVTAELPWIQEKIEQLTGIDTLPASVYQFSTLPSEIDAFEVAVVVAIAMVLALGATLFPSRQGARINPAEALRYE